ncbi:carbonic anhydrase 4a [Narcine bancroftii]|uniref:carbonic anhydrase 4a n=1 Tax=Narcine bancroftii TaxID=1343680 RepID=UPI0038321194
MKSPGLYFGSLLLPLLASGAEHWCYDSQDFRCGPSHWKDNFPYCGMKKQSPINIVTKKTLHDSSLGPILFKGYDDSVENLPWTILNNGHTVQVDLKGDLTIREGKLPGTYKALQFHYHWGTGTELGSEHTIDGKRYPMELHIVHMNQKYSELKEALKHPDGLAVLGFMIAESSEENSETNNVVKALKNIQQAGLKHSLKPFSLQNMIPDQEKLKKYYRYEGSLTTPHCNEAIIWTVFAEPIYLSKTQISEFPRRLFFNESKHMVSNFRPVQNLNGRKVYVSDSAVMSSNGALLSYVLAIWSFVLFH